MIKITHKKRYETFKKKIKYKTKNNNDLFIEQDTKDYGIVIDTTFNKVKVLYKDKLIDAHLATTFKSPCNKTIYPGDKVVLNNNEITGIIKRKNILSRDKLDSSRLNAYSTQKIIASNIDIAVIVVSSSTPPLHPKLIDRYIILLENSNIPFIICLNKCDLITEKERQIIKLYENIGIRVILTSTISGIGIDCLKEKLQNKQSIFVGHSGVGKSSLTQYIMKDDNIRIGKLRDKNNRGCHTTTTSTYYKWNDNSGIIDTPGIRSLDISNYDKNDIKKYFYEFTSYEHLCKYKDCLHYEEKESDCYIKQLVKKGIINQERYESYHKIISEIK